MAAFFFLFLILETLFYITLIKRGLIINGRLSGIILTISVIHTLLFIINSIQLLLYKGDIAVNENIDHLMNLTFLFAVGSIPKLIITITLITGRKRKKGKLASLFVATGWVVATIIMIVVLSGTFRGRYNFTIERVTLPVANLHPDLCSLKIVLISDLHLSSFHNNPGQLKRALKIIESLDPDILVNTGDYVTIGWKEMEPFTEIISSVSGKYGSVAIPGNHDTGIYHPTWNKSQMEESGEKIQKMVTSTGSVYLCNSHTYFSVKNALVSFTGITATGKVPDMIYGDIELAKPAVDTSNYSILLSHDPNYWIENPEKVKSFDLTLSGHTHGMQMGIMVGKIRISPAALLFPVWNGLVKRDSGYLYVNRGLGTLGFPFRIGMPPEITLLTLQAS